MKRGTMLDQEKRWASGQLLSTALLVAEHARHLLWRAGTMHRAGLSDKEKVYFDKYFMEFESSIRKLSTLRARVTKTNEHRRLGG